MYSQGKPDCYWLPTSSSLGEGESWGTHRASKGDCKAIPEKQGYQGRKEKKPEGASRALSVLIADDGWDGLLNSRHSSKCFEQSSRT